MTGPSPLLAEPAITAPLLNAQGLVDGSGLAIVLGGTLIATLARCGRHDVARALARAAGLRRRAIDIDANRSALARWARAVRRSGVLGADEALPPDPDLARAIGELVRKGSPEAFRTTIATARAQGQATSASAARVFEQAGELAPVFGLVGTLISMAATMPGLAAASAADAATGLAAIGTAILSSLYGVLSAHLLFLPLAEAIARRQAREDEARDALARWLCEQLDGDAGARVTVLKPAA
jgi:chemotaxis protein MotA